MIFYFRVKSRVMNKKNKKLLYLFFYSINRVKNRVSLKYFYSKLYFKMENIMELEMLLKKEKERIFVFIRKKKNSLSRMKRENPFFLL